jgi:hypothetical protein
MLIQDLKPNPRNPRKITEEKLEFLRKTLKKFGDLGCIVFNKKNESLVGGTQRSKVFDSQIKVVIETKYDKKTKVGTVAEGYIVSNGERHKYREVEWDEDTHKAATIAANKMAGEFDPLGLSELMRELNETGFDLDLTMFNEIERANFLADILDPNKEWHDVMPEFKQEDQSAEQQITINFKSYKDVVRFGKLIKQKLTENTRSIWFPKAPKDVEKKKYKNK